MIANATFGHLDATHENPFILMSVHGKTMCSTHFTSFSLTCLQLGRKMDVA